MGSHDLDFDDEDGEFMREMQQLFLENAADKVEKLTNAIRAIDQNRSDPHSLYEGFRLFHSLGGGAASYNLLPASEIGKRMEFILEKAHLGKIVLHDGHFAYFAAMIQALIRYFALAAEGDVKAEVELPNVQAYLDNEDLRILEL